MCQLRKKNRAKNTNNNGYIINSPNIKSVDLSPVICDKCIEFLFYFVNKALNKLIDSNKKRDR